MLGYKLRSIQGTLGISSLTLGVFTLIPAFSSSMRTRFMTVIQAGDYDLAHPELLWFFGIGMFFVLFLSTPSLATTQILISKFELFLDKWPIFCFTVFCTIVFRLRETFSCFTWGYDSYHWVASNYIRPGFLRFFYGLFVSQPNIRSEAEVLQNYIGKGQICEGFDMLYGVQAQQVFYFISLFILVVALRMTLTSPLIALLICVLICSGSITGQPITLRNEIMCVISGFLFGIFFINYLFKKPNPDKWLLFLVGLLFLPSFVLFDSTPFPGQEVMSESLYLGMLNLAVSTLLLLFTKTPIGHQAVQRSLLLILAILMVVLSQTRLQGLVLFIFFMVFLIFNIFKKDMRRQIYFAFLTIATCASFIFFQNSSSRAQEPMTFWGTAAIALEFIDESTSINHFDKEDRAVIKNALDRISKIKIANSEAGLPNDSQNLNPLYQGLIPAFDEVLGSSSKSRNEVFRSITIHSIIDHPINWIKFALGNLAHVFAIGLPIFLTFGIIPTVAMPYSTIFYSPILSLLFLLICLYSLLSLKKRGNHRVIMIFPMIFLLEIVACSTFSEPLSRYVRLTESFILIFVIYFLESLQARSFINLRYLGKS